MDSIGEGVSFASDGVKLFQSPPSRCMVSVCRLFFSPSTDLCLHDTLVAQRSRSPSPLPERRRSRSRSRDHDHRDRDWDRDRRRNKRSRSRSYSPRRGSRYSRSPRRSYNRYNKRSPSPRGRHSPRGYATDDEEVTDTFIKTVVAEVKGHGEKYEESLKELEKDNPKYSFLTDRHVSTPYTHLWVQLTVGLAASEAQILSIIDKEGLDYRAGVR